MNREQNHTETGKIVVQIEEEEEQWRGTGKWKKPIGNWQWEQYTISCTGWSPVNCQSEAVKTFFFLNNCILKS